ncbi:MAG: hypothetical protein HUU57_08515 [Bdellovibrio sp.]|nr:hypothetical protein [Bdellovibrio sp.]
MFGKFFVRILFAVLALTSVANASYFFHSYSAIKNKLHPQGDVAVIQYYHNALAPINYVIVDKRANTAILFGPQGQVLQEIRVQVFAGDELGKGGAGIYLSAGEHDKVHFGQAQKDGSIRGLFRGSLQVPANTPVYVIPQNSEHRFRLRNYGISFGADKVLKNRSAFNYSPASKTFHQSKLTTTLEDPFLRRYVKALQDEKVNLMKLLQLDNDDYNMLAEFSFGVLSPETNFGKSIKYRIKEAMPLLVAILKGNGLDTERNSQGPTQIKKIPQVISDAYDIEKRDLKEPENAAIATLAFVAGQLKELRTMASAHPGISEETLQDYLYYLYNGRRNEIRTGTASPEQNVSIRKIKSAIQQLKIEEGVEPLLLSRF